MLPFTLLALSLVSNLVTGQAQLDYTGRAQGGLLSWPLASVITRFQGSVLHIVLSRSSSDQSVYDIVVDGLVVDKIFSETSDKYVTVAAGTHELEIIKTDEAMYGEATVQNVTVLDGTLLPPTLPQRRIEVIGDSISAGYGVLGPNAFCQATAGTENSSLSYASLASAALGAQLNLIAFSGKGVYQNYVLSDLETMPLLWTRTDPYLPGLWNTTQFTPDVVLVNLGTNDFAHGIDIKDNFDAAYRQFVQQLKISYPNTALFLGIGPLLGGTARDIVLNTLTSLIAADTQHVHLIDFGTQIVDAEGNGAGCEYHPNTATHMRMAGVMESAVRNVTRWT